MAKKDAEEKDEDKESKGGGRKKLLIILVLVIVLVAGGATYWFVLKPKPGAAPPPPTPGAVVQLDPITINLANGHFLKLGLALQPTAAVTEVSGAKALDDAITVFSGRTITELSTADGREKAKTQLITMVTKDYDKEVYDVYFTEFVMQ